MRTLAALDAPKQIGNRQLAGHIAYLMDHASWTRTQVTPTVAFQTMRAWLGPYSGANDLGLDEFIQLLRAIDRLFPRAKYPWVDGKPNPNDGRITYTLSIGVEAGSPVLYVGRPQFGFTAPQLIALHAAGLAAHASESDLTRMMYGDDDDDSTVECRFWWD